MGSDNLKQLWESWDVRVLILLSLALQVLLVLSAPLRKRVSKWYVSIPLWLAYLFADIVAVYVVGLISKTPMEGASKGVPSSDLMVFWAPFLLLHLGGPETITAFAFEDNELWLRHYLALATQCVVIIYVFCLYFPKGNKKLMLPTLLMFFSGIIKYGERIRSLYLASSTGFRESLLSDPDPGPNYAKLMDAYSFKMDAGLPTKIDIHPNITRTKKKFTKPEDKVRLTDLMVVQRAHGYFNIFKGLIAGTMLSSRERNENRKYFLSRNSWEAFKMVEVELNFMYEILYTKAQVVQGAYGYLFRITSFGLTCASLLLFSLRKHKKDEEYEVFDIIVTYVLLGGAIALDTVAFVMVLSSDWTAVALSKPGDSSYSGTDILKKTKIRIILRKWLRVDRIRWPRNGTHELEGKRCSFMKLVRKRSSKTISQYNLIDCSLRPRHKYLQSALRLIGLTKILDSFQYVGSKVLKDNLRDLIFEELKMRSEIAENLDATREFYSARGDWILRSKGFRNLLPWVVNVDYDESLIMWHVATDLLYNTDDKVSGRGDKPDEYFKDMSKILSDYLLHVLIMNTQMMATVAGIGLIRHRDTCAEAIAFFAWKNTKEELPKKNKCFSSCFGRCICGKSAVAERGDPRRTPPPPDIESQNLITQSSKSVRRHEAACRKILAVNTAVKPVAVKGDKSKSLLFDGCMLAKQLNRIGVEDTNTKGKWEIICRVWIEMLCYAASHCNASTHAAQLSKGGELMTLVWLLMVHFGLGNQFQINEGPTSRLVIGK